MAYNDDNAKYKALVERDPMAEGVFIYCVLTTRICCRPTCSSRIPLKKNVVFSKTLEEAVKKGFTPCKRCKPDLSAGWNPTGDLIRVACLKISTLAAKNERLKMDALAAELKISKWHLCRSFKNYTEKTPKQYYDSCRRGEDQKPLPLIRTKRYLLKQKSKQREKQEKEEREEKEEEKREGVKQSREEPEEELELETLEENIQTQLTPTDSENTPIETPETLPDSPKVKKPRARLERKTRPLTPLSLNFLDPNIARVTRSSFRNLRPRLDKQKTAEDRLDFDKLLLVPNELLVSIEDHFVPAKPPAKLQDLPPTGSFSYDHADSNFKHSFFET